MQDIAGQGFFSLGMLARFEPALREKGASMYPRLFWETGLIGQVLYLEAHAFGVSATGIGCFFDDPGEIVDRHLSCPILKPSSVICMSNCRIEYWSSVVEENDMEFWLRLACAVHQVLGFKAKEFQSLYHFTVGVPVVDNRILNLPSYPGPPNANF